MPPGAAGLAGLVRGWQHGAMSLPPLYPITDPAAPLSLAAQIRRLGEAGFPVVQFHGQGLDAASQWRELEAALRAAAASGGWPAIVLDARSDLAGRALAAGLAPRVLALGSDGLPPGVHAGLEAGEAPACFRAGAEALALGPALARAEAPGRMLWRAQLERWQVRAPVGPGQGVVLVGGSGAGKSSLGARLAHGLDLPLRDSDERVEADCGLSIARIFAARGEAGFRALEARAVRACLETPAVLALGGGAWEDPQTRAAVRAAGFTPLWLAEVPERAWARVGRDPQRPLATGREPFLERWARRAAAWSEAAMVLPLGCSVSRLARVLAGAAFDGTKRVPPAGGDID